MTDEFEIVKTKGPFDLIRIANDSYVVRKRYKSFFLRRNKTVFMCMNLKGTDVPCEHIMTEITVADWPRALYVYNANLLVNGLV